MALLPRVTFSSAFNYADVTAPTLVSAEVLVDGLTFEIVFSEAVTIGAGGDGGFTIDTDGAAVTLAYASGDGTDTLVYTLSRTVLSTETFSAFDYVQPGDGVTDLVGLELATFTNQHGVVANSSGESGFTYLLQEDFEGSEVDSQGEVGYDNPSIVSSSTSNTPRYAISPAPLEGFYSFYPGASSRYIDIPISGNPRSFYCRARPVATTATATMQLMNGSTVLAIIEVASNKLKPTHGTVAGSSTTDSFAVNFNWRLWIDYVPANSGSNGVLKIGFSSGDTKPTSGTKFVHLTNGDATLEVTKWRIGGLGSQVIFDKIRASASEIGDDPA